MVLVSMLDENPLDLRFTELIRLWRTEEGMAELRLSYMRCSEHEEFNLGKVIEPSPVQMVETILNHEFFERVVIEAFVNGFEHPTQVDARPVARETSCGPFSPVPCGQSLPQRSLLVLREAAQFLLRQQDPTEGREHLFLRLPRHEQDDVDLVASRSGTNRVLPA